LPLNSGYDTSPTRGATRDDDDDTADDDNDVDDDEVDIEVATDGDDGDGVAIVEVVFVMQRCSINNMKGITK
jgi:hypothetical protein